MQGRYAGLSDSGMPGSALGEDIALAARASKLVSALYLVTSLMSEVDPTRAELRKSGVALVSDMSRSSGGVRAAARELVSVIVTLLGLSKDAGLMSAMNADMLSEKFLEFSGALARENHGAVGQTALSLLSDSFAADVKDNVGARMHVGVPKGHQASLPAPKRAHTPARHATQAPDTSRRQKIVDFIKDKKRAGIKEVSRVLPGLSEKTVQRELLELVRTRVLNKEGERRWSVYTLASHH